MVGVRLFAVYKKLHAGRLGPEGLGWRLLRSSIRQHRRVGGT